MNAKRLLNLVGDRLHTLPLLILYLTDGCNSRCVTCDIWRNVRRNMSLELVEELAGACRGLDIRWLLLSGGEAMQHPHWPEIARRFRAEGVHVMLLTNGLLLKRQAEQVAASVDEVIVSLDGGNPATYQAIRGVDAFDLILDGIRAVRAAGIPVTTRTTVQRANYAEIPQIIEVGLANDVNHISFLAVDVSSDMAFGQRTITPAHALTPDDIVRLDHLLTEAESRYAEAFAAGRIAESPAKLRRLLTYFRALNGETAFEPPRCNAPHTSVVVGVDGTLQPCYFLPAFGKIEAGDTLQTAINGGAAQALRQAYRTRQRPECVRCVCPLYKSPRALMRM